MEQYHVLCKSLSKLLDTTVRYFDREMTMLCIFPRQSGTEDALKTDYALLVSMLQESLNGNEPVVFVHAHKYYALVPVLQEKILCGLYIIGPVQEKLDKKSNLAFSAKLTSAVTLIHFEASGELLEESEILFLGSMNDTRLETKKDFDKNLQSARELNRYHGTYQYEKLLWQCIRTGDLKNLKFYSAMPYTGNVGMMVSNPNDNLRQSKNAFIAFVTMATRAAIDGGLNIEVAYTLSDTYIQQAERAASALEVNSLAEKVLLEFTTRVKRSKLSSYSKPIQKCMEYVQNHIFEKLKVQTIAAYTGYNSSYLA